MHAVLCGVREKAPGFLLACLISTLSFLHGVFVFGVGIRGVVGLRRGWELLPQRWAPIQSVPVLWAGLTVHKHPQRCRLCLQPGPATTWARQLESAGGVLIPGHLMGCAVESKGGMLFFPRGDLRSSWWMLLDRE